MLEFMFMEAGNLSSGRVLYLFQTEFYDSFFFTLETPLILLVSHMRETYSTCQASVTK